MASLTDDEDLFAQFRPASRTEPEPAQRDTNGTQGLGIDEEIKIKKARVPIPKLDENRLLSQAGLPKLRKITKNRLKLKGKGHEFTDIVRLLNLYQVWLDDLYPRAKFRDALAMIEKLGHKKRLEIMRKQWLRNLEDMDEARLEPNQETAATTTAEQVADPEEEGPVDPTPNADEDATVPDDELDALMNERVEENSASSPPPEPRQQRDQFADEEEAMAELDDWLL